MSKKEKATREYLETLSKDRVIELCLQFMFDANISEKQLDQANEKIMWLNAEIDTLKSEKENLMRTLEEASEELECAIVPKFKIGQECYLIDNNFNYFKNTKEFNIVCSNIKKQQNWYYVKDYGVYHENDLFATEQEAQTKLQELRGGE